MAKNSWSLTENINKWDSGSGKTILLLNLINHQPDIEKNHLYAKGPDETKY